MTLRKIRKLIILAFASVVTLLLLLPAITFQAPGWFVLLHLNLAFVILAPTIGFVQGVWWCRYVVAALALLILFLWSLSPLAQHEIDRHLFFWVLWAVIEALIASAVWASLVRAPIAEPR
jgi:hypothetical protein